MIRPVVLLALAAAACSEPDPGFTAYTLYRSSVAPGVNRIHVATFDAAQSDNYNQENCFTARDLFEGQEGVSVRYWCEAGAYHR